MDHLADLQRDDGQRRQRVDRLGDRDLVGNARWNRVACGHQSPPSTGASTAASTGASTAASATPPSPAVGASLFTGGPDSHKPSIEQIWPSPQSLLRAQTPALHAASAAIASTAAMKSLGAIDDHPQHELDLRDRVAVGEILAGEVLGDRQVATGLDAGGHAAADATARVQAVQRERREQVDAAEPRPQVAGAELQAGRAADAVAIDGLDHEP